MDANVMNSDKRYLCGECEDNNDVFQRNISTYIS